ncbi:class I SAM-dependent methyltransferase [Lutibacter sp.]|uniref:class I SAM-dependent methyltransferase n=1 Tax=Lutibacter sp. TaxID=1925666 RepID=UPI0025BB1FFE|nr:class I SAM-dependent methyltransferase [Lutibacter sp.]MCF6169011.1 methyltransferase domain-containing protein [Lutibacter sp.]
MNNTTTWNPELYNNKHSFVYNYGENLIELMNPKKEERILDLGCGSGQLTFKISEFVNEVIGLDKSPEMIADAKSKFKNIEFIVADASNFTFDKKFDTIFSNAVLHWVTNYEGAIKSMYKNLNDNGKIVLEFGGKGNVQKIINQLRISLEKRGYLKQSKLQLWYFPSIAEYTTKLESAGFRVLMGQHFDRPTELAKKNTGIKDWISMFANSFFENVTTKHIEEIKNEVQEKIKVACFINGKWVADYKRIRIVAIKEKNVK